MSSEPSIFFSDVNERQGSFLRRTFVLGGLTGLGVLGLTARLAQLQVVQAQEYTTLATANQFNFRLVPPPRGIIRDRDGVIIAGNRPSFRVLVVRDETKDLDQTLDLGDQGIDRLPLNEIERDPIDQTDEYESRGAEDRDIDQREPERGRSEQSSSVR